MPLPRAVARANKRFTNRFIEPVVARTAGFAVVSHAGRRSGSAYRTPVYAFPVDRTSTDGQLVVALTYGPEADWAKNVLAGGGTIAYRDTERAIGRATVVGREVAWPHLPGVVRFALRVLRVTDFMLL